MTAREKREKWLEKRNFYKFLCKKEQPFDKNDMIWYVVSDYGYEDVGYCGPYNFNEALKHYQIISGRNPICEYTFDDSMIHYITSNYNKLLRIDERQEY